MRRKGFKRAVLDESGFTLAELMVVIIIMTLLLMAVGVMVNSAARGSSANYNLVKVEEAGNEALSTILRQLRGAVCIGPLSDASSVLFAVDVDGNDNREKISYDVADGFLRRGIGPLNEEVTVEDWMDGCSDLRFTYCVYNRQTGQLEEIAPDSGAWSGGGFLEIRSIGVELTFSRGALGGIGLERTFSGSVALRNRLEDIL